jgi:hypothetical protein
MPLQVAWLLTSYPHDTPRVKPRHAMHEGEDKHDAIPCNLPMHFFVGMEIRDGPSPFVEHQAVRRNRPPTWRCPPAAADPERAQPAAAPAWTRGIWCCTGRCRASGRSSRRKHACSLTSGRGKRCRTSGPRRTYASTRVPGSALQAVTSNTEKGDAQRGVPDTFQLCETYRHGSPQLPQQVDHCTAAGPLTAACKGPCHDKSCSCDSSVDRPV